MLGSGPVVIWNLIRRCNLACKHCYATSADIDFEGELSTEEVYAVMDDLKAFGVSVLILSGGEPLLRPDIFDISQRARDMGFYVGLSSNGTLIDESNIDAIDRVGYDYLGVSLDGMRDTHDRFRRKQGAFDESIKAETGIGRAGQRLEQLLGVALFRVTLRILGPDIQKPDPGFSQAKGQS